MKTILSAFLAALALPVASLFAQTPAPTPYVETTTLTLFWGFSQTYVSNNSTLAPSLPDIATIDPDTLPTGFETYTDTGVVYAYTGPVRNFFPAAGNNRQLVTLLVQRFIREGKLSPLAQDYRWQFTAVRETPNTVAELASNPYRVFITAIEPTQGRPLIPLLVPDFDTEVVDDDPLGPIVLDTGITITLGAYSGSYTETGYSGATNKVRSASGSVTTAFSIDYGAIFYDDPRHLQKDPDQSPYNYHLKLNLWQASASGLITYTVRPISGPLASFVVATGNASATGWFTHSRTEVEYVGNPASPAYVDDPTKVYDGSGTAPLRVTMSTIQYQKRTLFFVAPATNLAASYDAPLNVVNLSWVNPSTGSLRANTIVVERKDGPSGSWNVIATLTGGQFGTTYTDDTVTPDTAYSYRVQAKGNTGGATYSNIVNITTTVP
jgi:hypothetical protein